MLSLSQHFIDYEEAQASDAGGNAVGNDHQTVLISKAVNGERSIISNMCRSIVPRQLEQLRVHTRALVPGLPSSQQGIDKRLPSVGPCFCRDQRSPGEPVGRLGSWAWLLGLARGAQGLQQRLPAKLEIKKPQRKIKTFSKIE